jgi:hypothetical protein
MSSYRSRPRSNAARSTGAGSRWMHLRYAGQCKVCGARLPAGTFVSGFRGADGDV